MNKVSVWVICAALWAISMGLVYSETKNSWRQQGINEGTIQQGQDVLNILKGLQKDREILTCQVNPSTTGFTMLLSVKTTELFAKMENHNLVLCIRK